MRRGNILGRGGWNVGNVEGVKAGFRLVYMRPLQHVLA